MVLRRSISLHRLRGMECDRGPVIDRYCDDWLKACATCGAWANNQRFYRTRSEQRDRAK
jgi:hypothetical protein